MVTVLAGAVAYFGWSFSVKDLPAGTFDSADGVKVTAEAYGFAVDPDPDTSGSGLIFLSGAFVAADAYLPLARSLAKEGHPVRLVNLPFGVAALPGQHDELFGTVENLITEERPWVLGGHSRGAAFAEEYVATVESAIEGLLLVGTTFPVEDDLSGLVMPVTKVYASEDGIAKPAEVLANRGQLPLDAQFVEIQGGNHSQFGYYGPQPLDGAAKITREEQLAQLSAAALTLLRQVDSAAMQSEAINLIDDARVFAAKSAFQFAVPARLIDLSSKAPRLES